jgi:hypothetical protein
MAFLRDQDSCSRKDPSAPGTRMRGAFLPAVAPRKQTSPNTIVAVWLSTMQVAYSPRQEKRCGRRKDYRNLLYSSPCLST